LIPGLGRKIDQEIFALSHKTSVASACQPDSRKQDCEFTPRATRFLV